MKIIKWVLIVVIGLIAIVLIAAIFVKKDFSVEKQIVVNKPLQVVYDYVLLLKNQNNFSKWATMDPAMEKTFTGVDGTVGFVSAWKSTNKNVGEGEQEITGIVPRKRIDYELRFKKPMEDTNNAYMIVDSISPDQTSVKWGFYGKMTYPTNVILLFMSFDQIIGGDFEYGLQQLKAILENQ